jgi:two-component system, sporulation sensor kinase A
MADAYQDLVVAELLATAFEAVPKPLIVSDYRTIIFANSSMRALLRVESPSQIEGHDPLEFLHPDIHEAVNERRRLLRDGAKGFRDLPIKLVTTDGGIVNASLAITPIEYEGFRFAVLMYEPKG